jgi:hypothetical protein
MYKALPVHKGLHFSYIVKVVEELCNPLCTGRALYIMYAKKVKCAASTHQFIFLPSPKSRLSVCR